MLRDRQEKEQLVRKFEEILPFLKNCNNFGWLIPECHADPVHRVYSGSAQFSTFVVNVQTGWHGEVVYWDDAGAHKIEEGVTPVKDEWSTYCYRPCCSAPAVIIPKEDVPQ